MKHILSALASLTLATLPLAAAETNLLTSLDLSAVEQEWGAPGKDHTVDNKPLSIGGVKFARGLGTHAASTFTLDLGGRGEVFTASVGVDDEVGKNQGSVVFQVLGDGKLLWNSPVLHSGDAARSVSVPLTGVKNLTLNVTDGGDNINFDHADWADAQIVMASGKPVVFHAPPEPAVVLTPKASSSPRLTGARVFGVRPGAPFLHTVPVTGERPIWISAQGLPPGLTLDPQSGRITGELKTKGEYNVTLTAGPLRDPVSITSKRELKIVCGDLIALTPPLGWNSWNCFGCDVNELNVRAAADAMVASGLVNHGWTYINIDDCWEAGRNAEGVIESNEKFPDMKRLADYVHSKGLKIGLYSSPGPKTCAGRTASYQFETQDARRWGEWGFDYIKYDWCSYGDIAPKNPDLAEMMKPYQVMRAALDTVPRDIVYSLCQYGMGNVWEWGAKVGGNCWRTTGDITDTWSSMSNIGFGQAGHSALVGPGHWNDPDMLVVGQVGWSAHLRPTKLTPNEQYTHISLWCLLASPLLIGCDMTKLDEFTLSLLTNDEVLEVNQDPLGRAADRVAKNGQLEVWSKDLADGGKAVGLFNRGNEEASASAQWTDLGVSGKQAVRDLWRQKDSGNFEKSFSASVPRHGVVLVKLAPVK